MLNIDSDVNMALSLWLGTHQLLCCFHKFCSNAFGWLSDVKPPLFSLHAPLQLLKSTCSIIKENSTSGSSGEALLRCILESLSLREIYFPKLWLFGTVGKSWYQLPPPALDSQRAVLDKILFNLHKTFKL